MTHLREKIEEIKSNFKTFGYQLYDFHHEAIAIRLFQNEEKLKIFQWAFDTWKESNQLKQLMSFFDSDGTFAVIKKGISFEVVKQ